MSKSQGLDVWSQALRMLALCVLSLAFACSDAETRTQLTFRIGASDALAARIKSLRVEVNGQQQTYPSSELNFPVEIVVLPVSGQQSTDDVTLKATALDAQSNVLAQQTASAAFKPGTNDFVPVALDADAVLPSDDDDDDDGRKPDASLDGGKDGSKPSEPDAKAPDEPKDDDAGMEPAPGPITCATPNSGIECDDENPCNGKETCDAENPDANNKGCVSTTPVTCKGDMTCDRNTGKCSSCETKADGDGDGEKSVACGGKDCDDGDENVAPKKPELCDSKDNDCDGVVDGAKADSDCKAPKDGTATCGAQGCTAACKDGFQNKNGVCVPNPVSCPIVNPCAPGLCVGGEGSYSCNCPTGFRAGVGMTKCVPAGTMPRTIGFETACGEEPTPGTYAGELKAMSPALYASCGVASFYGSAMMTAPQLIKPLPAMTTIAGITKETALVVPAGASTATVIAPSELIINFTAAVNELSFDVLDIDNPAGLTITLHSGTTSRPGTVVPPAALSKQTRFSYKVAGTEKAVDKVTLSYTPLTATDALYIDELTFRLGGCGDGVMDPGEACDDGNAVQCDGCDNACAVSSKGCLSDHTCLASGANTADGCGVCDVTGAAPATEVRPVRSPTAPVTCAP